MDRIDVSDGFDVHDYRHGLKLLREDRASTHLENRAGFACPACEDPFDRLLVTERRTHSFPDPGRPFCVARTDEKLLLLTHERE